MDSNFYKLLFISLGGSFVKLVRQAELEALVERVLVNRTVTLQCVELISSKVKWITNPSEVRLNVGVVGTLTPNQVRLLEEFITKETDQRFTLIFQVHQIEEIKQRKNEQSAATTE